MLPKRKAISAFYAVMSFTLAGGGVACMLMEQAKKSQLPFIFFPFATAFLYLLMNNAVILHDIEEENGLFTIKSFVTKKTISPNCMYIHSILVGGNYIENGVFHNGISRQRGFKVEYEDSFKKHSVWIDARPENFYALLKLIEHAKKSSISRETFYTRVSQADFAEDWYLTPPE